MLVPLCDTYSGTLTFLNSSALKSVALGLENDSNLSNWYDNAGATKGEKVKIKREGETNRREVAIEMKHKGWKQTTEGK